MNEWNGWVGLMVVGVFSSSSSLIRMFSSVFCTKMGRRQAFYALHNTFTDIHFSCSLLAVFSRPIFGRKEEDEGNGSGGKQSANPLEEGTLNHLVGHTVHIYMNGTINQGMV